MVYQDRSDILPQCCAGHALRTRCMQLLPQLEVASAPTVSKLNTSAQHACACNSHAPQSVWQHIAWARPVAVVMSSRRCTSVDLHSPPRSIISVASTWSQRVAHGDWNHEQQTQPPLSKQGSAYDMWKVVSAGLSAKQFKNNPPHVGNWGLNAAPELQYSSTSIIDAITLHQPPGHVHPSVGQQHK